MERRRPSPVQKWNGSQGTAMSEEDRLAGDRELYALLLEENFSGANYAEFVTVLVSYGFGVIGGWVRRGVLLNECRKKRIQGLPADGTLFTEDLDAGQRDELVADIVAEAVIDFTEKSMRGRRWTPAGRASMKTYFIGGCLFSSVRPLQLLAQKIDEDRSRAEHEQNVAKHYLNSDEPVDLSLGSADLADEVVLKLHAEQLAQQLPPNDQLIIGMKSEGYTYKDIARRIGSTPKGVESRMKRIRRESQERKDKAG